jgi:hypothetical protein
MRLNRKYARLKGRTLHIIAPISMSFSAAPAGLVRFRV